MLCETPWRLTADHLLSSFAASPSFFLVCIQFMIAQIFPFAFRATTGPSLHPPPLHTRRILVCDHFPPPHPASDCPQAEPVPNFSLPPLFPIPPFLWDLSLNFSLGPSLSSAIRIVLRFSFLLAPHFKGVLWVGAFRISFSLTSFFPHFYRPLTTSPSFPASELMDRPFLRCS